MKIIARHIGAMHREEAAHMQIEMMQAAARHLRQRIAEDARIRRAAVRRMQRHLRPDRPGARIVNVLLIAIYLVALWWSLATLLR